MLLTVLYFLTILPFAAFFGIAVYTFIAPFYGQLSGPAFTEFFQKVDPYMKVWAKILLLSELILTALLLVLQGNPFLHAPGALCLVALVCAIASLVLAVRGNVPLNRQMDLWNPQSPPENWTKIRDAWLRFHHLRGACEIIGFLALLAAAFLHASRPA